MLYTSENTKMQSSEEIEVKKFLHAWLGRKRLAVPVYNSEIRVVDGSAAGFRCEVRSTSFSNIFGFGRGQSKKEAMTKAARDFCWKLIGDGRMKISEAPFLQVRRSRFQIDYRAIGGHEIGDAEIRGDKIPSDPHLVDGHTGGWDINNCESRLDDFIKTNNIAICRKFIPVGFGQHSAFLAEVSFTLQEPGSQSEIEIYAREEAKTKEVASAKCALKVIRRLYQLQLIGSARREHEKLRSQTKAFPPIRSPTSKSLFASPPATVTAKPLKKVFRPYIDHDAVCQEDAVADFNFPDPYQPYDEPFDNNAGEAELGDWNEHETGKETPHYQLICPKREEPIIVAPMGNQQQIRLRQEEQAGYWKFSGAVLDDQ